MSRGKKSTGGQGCVFSGGLGESPSVIFPLLEATRAFLRMGHELGSGEDFAPKRFHPSQTDRKSKISIIT